MTDPALPTAVDEAEELNCPVCGYSLRGLPEPRCPECGYTFQWEELRERARLRRGWFYEHAETFTSHVKTRWRSLRPRKFWAEIGAYTAANPKRLWRYRLTTLVLVIVCLTPFALPSLMSRARQWVPRPRTVVATTLPTSGAYRVLSQPPVYVRVPAGTPGSTTQPNGRVIGGFPQTRFPSRAVRSRLAYALAPPQQQVYVYFVPQPAWAVWLDRVLDRRQVAVNTAIGFTAIGFGLALPFLLPLYWLLLRGSVLRANVRPVHLSRVDAYSTDALPLLLLLAIGAEILLAYLWSDHFWRYATSYGFTVAHASLVPAVVATGLTWRLAAALRGYVRFPHAWPVAIAFGVIVGLAWLAVVLPLTVYRAA